MDIETGKGDISVSNHLRNVHLTDCTLRGGSYLVNFQFNGPYMFYIDRIKEDKHLQILGALYENHSGLFHTFLHLSKEFQIPVSHLMHLVSAEYGKHNLTEAEIQSFSSLLKKAAS